MEYDSVLRKKQFVKYALIVRQHRDYGLNDKLNAPKKETDS
jgi:hypothetical protein